MENIISVKCWNWGTVKFDGLLFSFDTEDQPAFEIPLRNMSQCTTGKNEVTLEFHQNVDVHFYVPPALADVVDQVEAFAHYMRSKTNIWIYTTFLHLHGKTFDYKIPYTPVPILFSQPPKDQHQIFFVIILDPPIKQDQTLYHFLILLFSKDKDISLPLNKNKEEMEKHFDRQLIKNMLGPLQEMVSQVMKALVNHKITIPGNFQGHLGAQCITCSYKASSDCCTCWSGASSRFTSHPCRSSLTRSPSSTLPMAPPPLAPLTLRPSRALSNLQQHERGV
ncbi:hypothetical protein HPG69_006663 [Diceros bicornis minor]|uniref:FACT complex subunit SSRP1 n=1 Tax=Diceros bicornis minor TaxID=77932 RepID=A0A7J7F608_DICBM|nr:hypothetical protein HPG69_006663 [Diceros bicornis minor]